MHFFATRAMNGSKWKNSATSLLVLDCAFFLRLPDDSDFFASDPFVSGDFARRKYLHCLRQGFPLAVLYDATL